MANSRPRLYLDTTIPSAYYNEYLKILNIPENDAVHIATATIFNCEILLSWNFTHMVNSSNKQKINEINALNGYNAITIISPLELRG